MFFLVLLYSHALKADLYQILALEADTIYLVDPLTAVRTPYFHISNLPPNVVTGNLSYSPVDNLLYLIEDPSGTPKLASVSMNGIYTSIGNITLPGQTVYLVESMAYHTALNKLYLGVSLDGGVATNDFYSESVITVDPNTAVATFVTTLTNSSLPAPDIDRMCFDGDTLIMSDVDTQGSTTIFFQINTSNPLGSTTNTTPIYTNPQMFPGIDMTLFCNDIYFTYNNSTSNMLRKYNYITGLDQQVGITHPYNSLTVNRFKGITKAKIPMNNDTIKVCQTSYTHVLPVITGLSYFDLQMNPITSVTSSITQDVPVIVQRFCELDTFTVRFEITSPAPDEIIDTIVCNGSVTLYAGNNANDTYVWNTNCTGNICVVDQAGAYEVEITNAAGCISKKTFNVSYYTIPTINLSFEVKEICNPTKVVFYNISDLSTLNNAFLTLSSGQVFSFMDSVVYETSLAGSIGYSVSGTSMDGCIIPSVSMGSFNVPKPPVAGFNPSNFDVFIDNPSIYFYDASIAAEQYVWLINDTFFSIEQNPQYVFSDTGHYLITQIVSNNIGCTDTISKVVNVKPIFRIFLPNSFSPNGDNMNDVFEAQYFGIGLESFELTIYNRWGEIVKLFAEVDDIWDGTKQGSPSPMGVYTYKLSCQYKEQKDETKYGMILLIR